MKADILVAKPERKKKLGDLEITSRIIFKWILSN
jgi:hypothetical protein